MQYLCRFGFGLHRFRDRFGATRWSGFFSFQFSKFPDKAGRDSPVISQTTSVGQNDSPLLMGPDERKDDQ